MDQDVLKLRAAEVADSLKRFLQSSSAALIEEHLEQNVRLAESMRSNSDRLDKSQAERDSQLLADIAAKNTSIREDVVRFGKDQASAHTQALEAATTQILATIRAELSDQHKAITEEIAVAVRSNFEILMAEIKGLGSRS